MFVYCKSDSAVLGLVTGKMPKWDDLGLLGFDVIPTALKTSIQ